MVIFSLYYEPNFFYLNVEYVIKIDIIIIEIYKKWYLLKQDIITINNWFYNIRIKCSQYL